jgi:serine/threonine protein kinase, bacterial
MSRLLDNRYNILQNLAEGGFGTTFLAADTRTPSQRPYVVKQLKPVSASPEMQALITQRFTREAAVLETLGRQNRQIPLLYAYFQENNDYYLVQEYIQGETLTQSVQRQGTTADCELEVFAGHSGETLEYLKPTKRTF